jgi:hypothetical protein
MTAFDTYTREQLRQSYAQAWAKHLARTPLTPLEALIADVIGAHPEYQQLMTDPDAVLAFEANTDGRAENPFLHMGLHLAVREQLAIDRPPGVRDLLKEFQAPLGDAHRAEHVLMEALGETLWKAQRSGQAPDEKEYLTLARARLARLRAKPSKS